MLGTPKFLGLRDHTKAVIEKLGSVQWFRAVGMSVSEDVRIVSSWEIALAEFKQGGWEDALHQASNRVSSAAFARDRDRHQLWNHAVDAIKPILQPLVYKQTLGLLDQGIFDYETQQLIYGDLLHVCEEAEYSDLVEPGLGLVTRS